MSTERSYSQILKASSIMGGAAGMNMLLGMVRVKFAAVLIGTAGVGLGASFAALQALLGTIAGLGIQSSAVREIAAAVGTGDEHAIGRAVLSLRRVCWVTGLAGMIVIMLLSPLLSQVTFGHREYSVDIAALGIMVLCANLSGGQMALIQGTRRIDVMARANVVGAALATATAIGLYAAFALRGVVPALVAGGIVQLAVSSFFARQVAVQKVVLSWGETFAHARGMLRLGLVVMFNNLMISVVSYVTVALISQHQDVKAVGIYSAAFALSGVLVNFVLGAMAADFLPRLTSVARDKAAMCRIVNEQTEIGVLLVLPGLFATLALAPWILQIFYTRQFVGAATLLQWFILGCLGRVVSWPLGYVMLALENVWGILVTETTFNVVHIGLIVVGLHLFGLEGVAIGFFALYLLYVMTIYLVCRRLIDFVWSRGCKRIALFAVPLLAAALLACRTLSLWPASIAGIVLTFTVSFFCLHALATRIAPGHRVISALTKLPGLKSLLPSR